MTGLPAILPPRLATQFFEPQGEFLDWFADRIRSAVGVVECGAGTGHLALALEERGCRVLAIDCWPPDNAVTRVYPFDATAHRWQPGHVAVVARPGPATWHLDVLRAALDAGAEAYWIDRPERVGTVAPAFGRDAEVVCQRAGHADEGVLWVRRAK